MKKQPKKKQSIVFRADLVDMPWDKWPLVRPRASPRVLKWLSLHVGGSVRCTYELVSKGKQS